ncbi:MAG TPA: peptidase M17, partial [Pseudonocardiaceae bacterium]
MPARTSTIPAVPTSLAQVELSDLVRRGALRAALVGPADGESAQVWLGPEADELLDGDRPADLTGKAGELHPVPGGKAWLLGVGARRGVDWRTAGATLARAADDAL